VRFAITSAGLMLALVSAAAPLRAQSGTSLDALLAHVRASSGRPYAVRVVSEAQIEVEEGTISLHVETQGLRMLVRRCRQKICSGEYFDGERSYDVNMNDTALPSTLHGNDEERVLRAISTMAFASPEFSALGGVSESSSVTRDGITYPRVAVRSGDATLLVLLDPKTFLPVEAQTPEGRTAFSYGDFRKVGALTLPFEIRHGEVVLERYDRRVVADGTIAMPAGVVPKFGSQPAAIPIAGVARPWGRSNQPVVPCTIGGVKVNCLFDTGNSGLSMSLELSEQLGLEPYGEYEIAGVGSYVTGVVSAGALSVGNATYPAAHYVILHDLHQLGYDVVLGADAFAHSVVTMDFGARTVAVGATAETQPATTLPLRFNTFVPTVPMQLGAFDVPLALDTGDEATINVSSRFFQNHPGLFAPRGSREVSGIGGNAEQIVGEVADARIATFDLLRQPIGVTHSPEAAAAGHVGDGILGHFVVTLDYARATLGLTPRHGDAAVHGE
jgi:hypothetical protein